MKRHFLMFITAALILAACKKNDPQTDVSPQQLNLLAQSTFLSPVNVGNENGVMTFSTYEEMDQFNNAVIEFGQNVTEINNWEVANGFNTQRKIFYNVMKGEDSVENLFVNQVLTGNQIYSTAFNQAMSDGVIAYQQDPSDQSVYWGLKTKNISKVNVITKDGLVKIDNKMHKYYADGTLKILLNPNFPISSMDNVATTDQNVAVYPHIPTPQIFSIVRPMSCKDSDAFSRLNSWHYPESRKRTKAELFYSSARDFGPTSCGLRYGVRVSFYIQTLSQKKNFWGKWVQTLSYWPAVYWGINSRTYTYRDAALSNCIPVSKSNDFPIFPFSGTLPGDPHFSWRYGNGLVLPINPSKSGWYAYTSGRAFACTPVMTEYDIYLYTEGKDVWGFQ